MQISQTKKPDASDKVRHRGATVSRHADKAVLGLTSTL